MVPHLQTGALDKSGRLASHFHAPCAPQDSFALQESTVVPTWRLHGQLPLALALHGETPLPVPTLVYLSLSASFLYLS